MLRVLFLVMFLTVLTVTIMLKIPTVLLALYELKAAPVFYRFSPIEFTPDASLDLFYFSTNVADIVVVSF